MSTSFPPLPWNRTHQQIADDVLYRYQDGTLMIRVGDKFVRMPPPDQRIERLSPSDRTRMLFSDEWRDDRQE